MAAHRSSYLRREKIVPTHLRRGNSSYVHLSMVSTAISVKCLQTVCKPSTNRLQTIFSIVTELVVIVIDFDIDEFLPYRCGERADCKVSFDMIVPLFHFCFMLFVTAMKSCIKCSHIL